MGTEFNILMTHCREAYAVFQQMASRTDDALYEALGQVHALRIEMHTNPTLRAEFDDLLQRHAGGKPTNETLLLVKYAFFPDTLQPGPGHKADLNKASRYAKLINTALDNGVEPGRFVAFAREHGIQRTAINSRRIRRSNGTRRPNRRGKRGPRSSPAIPVGLFLATALAPLEPWLYSSAVAERLASMTQKANDGPQRIRLTIYVNNKQAVLTGIAGESWQGEFPEGAIRISSPTQQPRVNVGADPGEQHLQRRTGLPRRMRGTPIGPVSLHRGRPPRVNGYPGMEGSD